MKIISKCRAYKLVRLCIGSLIVFLLSVPINLLAQNLRNVTGTILDGRTNAPMSDVSVIVKGSGLGAKTGANGGFTSKARQGDILVLSFAGYETHEVPLQAQTNISYTLKESNSKLDEVVVIGYGTGLPRRVCSCRCSSPLFISFIIRNRFEV